MKPQPSGCRSTPSIELEIDVVDALAVFVAVDQVQRRAANALDRRQAKLHRPGRNLDRLSALFQRQLVGFVRIGHPEGHAAGAGAVLLGEVGSVALRLCVEDEIDAALAPQRDVLGSVLRHLGEAEHFEHRFQYARLRRGELDEFEAVEAHRVFIKIGHGPLSLPIS